MTRLHLSWYRLSKLPDGRDGCIIHPTLRGALEIAASHLHKAGQNDEPSQITTRPDPPAPIKVKP